MLVLTDIRKSFGATVAVDGLSLRVGRGEVFGLLGPNGAGKSTTISIAIGLLPPDSGTVTLEGLGDPRHAAARRHIGVAPQALAIYDDLSAAENLLFIGRMYGIGHRALRGRVADLLELVGLTDRARDRAGTFSGGMKRRLNLAAAIVHEPPLVLLDEPTAGVDPQSRNNLLELVRTLRARGCTVLYTTHYMEEAQRLCDRVAIIDRGRVLAVGTVDELIARHGGRSVLTVTTDSGERRIETDDPLRELAGLMPGGGIANMRIDRPDLESVFLHLTGRLLRD
ncbi:MAG: ABC transporter ATP-binding protein [Phycisphaerales bacterium]|nr:ABC transporter ATP-binding protein [Phycisphaerales bacterium]